MISIYGSTKWYMLLWKHLIAPIPFPIKVYSRFIWSRKLAAHCFRCLRIAFYSNLNMVLTRKEQPSGRIGMRMSRRRILGGAGCRRWPNHVMRHANIVKNTCGPNSKPLHSTPHQSSSSCHFTWFYFRANLHFQFLFAIAASSGKAGIK